MIRFIVEIESAVWLAPWMGDPGRTLVKESAKTFITEQSARRALNQARKYHPFRMAAIWPVEFKL